MSKINESNAWAIASGKVIMPWSVRSTRKEAIKALVENFKGAFGDAKDWRVLKNKGYSAIRIRMLPVTRA